MTLLHNINARTGGALSITNQPGLTISLVFQEEQLIVETPSVAYDRIDA